MYIILPDNYLQNNMMRRPPQYSQQSEQFPAVSQSTDLQPLKRDKTRENTGLTESNWPESWAVQRRTNSNSRPSDASDTSKSREQAITWLSE